MEFLILGKGFLKDFLELGKVSDFKNPQF